MPDGRELLTLRDAADAAEAAHDEPAALGLQLPELPTSGEPRHLVIKYEEKIVSSSSAIQKRVEVNRSAALAKVSALSAFLSSSSCSQLGTSNLKLFAPLQQI